ncbi:MAG TPA: RDD family protein [Streptosporangiaceae bacterium]|nr:RDD family protein [Streptosporangiaceae bacterium]
MAEVVTGEAVVLDLAIARFPSRILAQLIDVAVQIPVLAFLYEVVGTKAAAHLNQASAAALYLVGFIMIVVAYPATFETLSRGKTLGKLALGIRVVSDDGSPERFRQAFIRALSAALFEIWLLPFNLIGIPAGLITSMVSAKGKRLGDLFAGTFVIQERVPKRPELPPAFTIVPPPLLEWASHMELALLPDQAAAMASSYLRRYHDLRPEARIEIGTRIASTVSAYVSPPPPPGTPPEAYLAAVLAVRRHREQAAMVRRQLIQQSANQATPGQPAQPTQVSPAIGQLPVTEAVPSFGPPAADQVPVHPNDQAAADRPTPDSPPEDFGFAAPF